MKTGLEPKKVDHLFFPFFVIMSATERFSEFLETYIHVSIVEPSLVNGAINSNEKEIQLENDCNYMNTYLVPASLYIQSCSLG